MLLVTSFRVTKVNENFSNFNTELGKISIWDIMMIIWRCVYANQHWRVQYKFIFKSHHTPNSKILHFFKNPTKKVITEFFVPKLSNHSSRAPPLLLWSNNIFFQIPWKSWCHILVTFPSRLKKLRSIIAVEGELYCLDIHSDDTLNILA